MGCAGKKGEHWHAIKVLAGNMEELGHNRVIVRSDQEPAILKLKQAVKRETYQEMVCEESLVGGISIAGECQHPHQHSARANQNAARRRGDEVWETHARGELSDSLDGAACSGNPQSISTGSRRENSVSTGEMKEVSEGHC